MVIDDDMSVLMTLEGALRDMGYLVTACNDSKGALAILRMHPEDFDLLITDQVMPVMGGDELASEVSTLIPALPIILLTGHSELIGEHNYQEFGIVGYCQKPVSLENLGRLVSGALREMKAS